MGKELNQHKSDVADIGCIITHNSQCCLHHARSGSISSNGLHHGLKRPSDWFVIPLIPMLHNGDKGIHTIGVKTWESMYGSQVSMLWEISDILGYNVFEKAGFNIERI